jgi:hypothetical protein
MTILTNWESSDFLQIDRENWNGKPNRKKFNFKIIKNKQNKAQTANNAHKKLLNSKKYDIYNK